MLALGWHFNLIVLAVVAVPQSKGDLPWPRVRETNYVALLPKAGTELRVEVESRGLQGRFAFPPREASSFM